MTSFSSLGRREEKLVNKAFDIRTAERIFPPCFSVNVPDLCCLPCISTKNGKVKIHGFNDFNKPFSLLRLYVRKD